MTEKASNTKRRVLLVDDDPLFRYLVQRAAWRKGIEIVTCGSLSELRIVASAQAFDVIILDYFLDPVRHRVVGTDIAELAGSTPCLLVSSSDQCLEANELWPQSIRQFLSKHVGASSVLDRALSLLAKPEVFHDHIE